MRQVMALCVLLAGVPAQAADEFLEKVRPILADNCAACHNSAKARGPANFLVAQSTLDVEKQRRLWRNVAAQLRNRTMPPVATKLTEEQRLYVSTWIDRDLKRSACSGEEFAGAVTLRRLNRREYRNTVRDLLGVELDVYGIFPEDGSGGEGFDTNGETLYLSPILMEKYLQAAQQIVDRVVVTPPLVKSFSGADLKGSAAGLNGGRRTLAPGEQASGEVSVYEEGTYSFNVTVSRSLTSALPMVLKVDGVEVGQIAPPRYETKGPTGGGKTVRLTRGSHTVAVQAKDLPVEILRVEVASKSADKIPEDKLALHYRLFGQEPGESPLEPRAAAARVLANFARKAYRRPVTAADIDPLLKLYDRSAQRGDPFEERVKLALKAVLVSPKFLFRIEEASDKPGVRPLTDYELAARLSYFLWSTMPDEALSRLAEEGKLHESAVLASQVERMLADSRSRVFATTFVGQWLGTKDVGLRVVPAFTELQDFYTPEVAADLREEPVLLFQSMLARNRSLLDLLDANYTYLTERLVKFYQVESQFPGVLGNDFQRVEWKDSRRGGVLGMASMLAMTSHFKQTSPVLRGAWVLDTLLGTTVPPPPPNVPPLEASASKGEKLTVRQQLTRHRADAACATCHKLIDPIGFGLENFDWMGRWRDTDNGHPVDASAEMPSGEKLNGPVELRKILLNRKEDFVQNVTAKVLGYALGRSLLDGDQCTVQRISQAVEKDGYGARTLVREVVLSVPFRNAQRDNGSATPLMTAAPKRKPEPKPTDR
jgi:cytochrome c553